MGFMAKFTYAQEIWDDVQRDYEFGTSVNKLGQHYGISRQAIMSKAKRFKWQKPSAGNASAQDATGERIVQTDATAPVVEQVASAILESGDLRAALVMTHREEWVEIDFIRTEAIQAFKDPTFRPEDAGEKWDSKSRLAHGKRVTIRGAHSPHPNLAAIADKGCLRLGRDMLPVP